MDNEKKCHIYCSVYGCKSFYGSQGVTSMYSFPEKGKKKVKIVNKMGKEELVDKRLAWMIKLKMGKKVTNTMKVCSLHFSENNYPPRVPGKIYKKIYLKDDAVPDCHLPKSPQHGSVLRKKIERCRPKRRLVTKKVCEKTSGTEKQASFVVETVQERNDTINEAEVEKTGCNDIENDMIKENTTTEIFSASKMITTRDCAVQTCSVVLDKITQTLGGRYVRQILQEEAEEVVKVLRLYMSYEVLNDEQFEYFTGLTRKIFDGLLDLLGREQCMKLKYFNAKKKKLMTPKKILKTMTIENQLLMTLTRLRRGFAEQELAYFFQVSQATVSRIVTMWFQFLYLEFRKYSDIMFNCVNTDGIPHCFNNKYFKNLVAIIDCTEIAMEKPSNFEQQGNTYSSYKSTNTVKFLVGINIQGGISFVSEGFEGCISDRELVIKSGFLEYLNSGQTVLADRGFTIKDILDPLGVKLIIPPFLNGRDKFTPMEELETKYIARSRVHVERTMHLIKSFVIFKLPVTVTILPMITQMFFVACFLVNFQTPYVS